MKNNLVILNELANANIEKRAKFLQHENYAFERSAYTNTLWNWDNAWNEYLNNKDIDKMKMIFNESGYIDIQRAKLFNHRILDMQNPRNNLCCVALSDNSILIDDYAEMDYLITYFSRDKEVNITFREFAKKGEAVSIFSLSVLNVFKKDIDELTKSVEILKKTITTKKSASSLIPDFEFLESLLTKDKDNIKSKIEFFLNKKLHKQRMKEETLLSNYISLPAILYLKLAWMLGFEIEIDNPLIPMDLMPIKKLSNYGNKYLELIK